MPVSALSGPYAALLPPGAFTFDDALFEQQTRVQKRDLDAVPLPALGSGFGQPFKIRIPQAGIVGHVNIDFIGTAVVTLNAGTVAVNPRWPGGFISGLTLRISGSNTDYDTTGRDLKILQHMRNKNVTDSLDVSAVTTAGGTTNIRLSWQVPFNLSRASEPSGGLFTLSSNTELDLACVTASLGELFTVTGAATVVIAGNFIPRIVWYDVPSGKMANGAEGMILPTLDHFHVLKHQTLALNGGGTQDLPLDHIDGSLMRLWSIATGGAPGTAEISPLPGKTNKAGIRYATSNIPLNPSTDYLVRQADALYRGMPPYNALVVHDASENLVRDLYQLSGLPDPKLELTFDASATIGAGAGVEVAYELLIPIATGIA